MSVRTEKVASLIREELGMILSHEINSNEIGFVTITNVIMTNDLHLAKINISIFADEEKQKSILKEIKNNKPKFRKLLGNKLNLKFTPDLNFYIDDTLNRMDKIESLFKQIHKDDNQ